MAKECISGSDIKKMENIAKYLSGQGLWVTNPFWFAKGSEADKIHFDGEIEVITGNVKKTVEDIMEDRQNLYNRGIESGSIVIGTCFMNHEGHSGTAFFLREFPEDYRQLIVKLEDMKNGKIPDITSWSSSYSVEKDKMLTTKLGKIENLEKAVSSIRISGNLGITTNPREFDIWVHKKGVFTRYDPISGAIRCAKRVLYLSLIHI